MNDPSGIYDDQRRTDYGIHDLAFVASFVVMGHRVEIHPMATVGTVPFSYDRTSHARPIRKPCSGGVKLGDDVEIMAHANVDRGVERDTEIGNGSKLDHYAHIGHDSRIGENVVVCAQAFVGGFVEIGDGAYLGAQCSIRPRLKIGAGAKIGMGAVVLADVAPGETVAGVPAKPTRWPNAPKREA